MIVDINGAIEILKGSVKPVAVYGAGTVADFFFYSVAHNGFEDRIEMFVVTRMGGNQSLKHGIPVRRFEEVTRDLKDHIVFVAARKEIQDEIVDTLKCPDDTDGIDVYAVEADSLVDGFYAYLHRSPIDKCKILGQNQNTAGYGDNPKYIFEELHRRDHEGKLVLVWSVPEKDDEIPQYVRQVIYGSHEYYRELATAHIWLDNARKPLLTKKRPGQIYIQTWHGAAPVKMVEADAADSLGKGYVETAGHDSKMADLFISGSAFYTKLYRKSFWYDGEILESGLPRQDVFWDRENIKNKIYDKYDIAREDAVVLYAPTFRSSYSEGCYDLHLNDVSKALEKRFKKRFVVLVSRHPVNHDGYSFGPDEKYISIKRNQDFEEVLAAADVLITDYSGCMYDFSFSKCPVFLFQPDYDTYVTDRDFYVPMDELPYVRARSNAELIERIAGFDSDTYSEKLERFMISMGNYDDGHASERVADHIIEHYLGEL